MTTILVRRATEADAEAVAEVHLAGWQWGYREQLPADFLASLASEAARQKRADHWTCTLRSAPPEPAAASRVWIAERDGVVAGFAATILPQDRGPVDAPHPPLTAELGALYLHEAEAGRGVGRALLARAVEDLGASGYRRVVLWVLAANGRSRRFYEAAGWRPTGEAKTDERTGPSGEPVALPQVRYARAIEQPVLRAAEVRTARLLLRQWRGEDREPFARLNADPCVMEHFPAVLDRGESDALADRLAAAFAEHGVGRWAVEVPGVARFIGFVGLAYPHLPPPFVPRVEVAWRIAHEHWGRGYAPEAARAAVETGFDVLGLDEIVSMTVPANLRSRRVMEKIGMRRSPADDFDHPKLPAGHPLERHVLYRLGRNDPRPQTRT